MNNRRDGAVEPATMKIRPVSRHRVAPAFFAAFVAGFGLAVGFPAGAPAAEPWAGGSVMDEDVVAAADAAGEDQVFDPRLAIQLLDQVAGAAHCGFREFLEAEGAWPPCGRDIAYHRALCDLAQVAREMRFEARKRFLSVAVLQLQVAKCRSIGSRIERAGGMNGLPHCVDEPVQDALDLIAMLDAYLNPSDT